MCKAMQIYWISYAFATELMKRSEMEESSKRREASNTYIAIQNLI